MQPTEHQRYLSFMGIESWRLRNKPSCSSMPKPDEHAFSETEGSVSTVAHGSLDAAVDKPSCASQALDIQQTAYYEQGRFITPDGPSETGHMEPSAIKPEAVSLATIPLTAVTSWQFGFVIRHKVLWCFESLTTESEQQLAQAILGSLTQDYSTPNFAYHQWPLLDDEPLSAATARLQAFMKTLKGQVAHIVSAGSLNQRVFQPLLSSDWLWQQATLIELPSLQQMLEDASYKRIAWESLKPHAQALTADKQ